MQINKSKFIFTRGASFVRSVLLIISLLLFNACFLGNANVDVILTDPNLAAEAPSGNDALSGS
ncbi:MAG: hypothetical protein ABUK01_19440, partial [Leptospirales bacterium]